MLSLALTHYNRFDLLLEAVAQVVDDPRVDEIVVSDDASTDGSYEAMVAYFSGRDKVRLFRNERNVDCYANKARAVERATGPWVILFDSDNVMTPAYLDRLSDLRVWHRTVAYLPTFAEPEFDYTRFEGLRLHRHNVASWTRVENFLTALNTANYLVHRDEYLKIWDPDVDPHTSDSIYMNLRWLEAGNALHFVPGLRYFHRVHDGSHFVQNQARTGAFAREVETRLRELR